VITSRVASRTLGGAFSGRASATYVTLAGVLFFFATGTQVFDMAAILFAKRWRSSCRSGAIGAVMRKLTG
jgi:hypothetical protein